MRAWASAKKDIADVLRLALAEEGSEPEIAYAAVF
jgi:hypothetical protein